MPKEFEDKKLINRIFIKLNPIPEFKNLSMDRKAEICISITKMIESKDEYKDIDWSPNED